jgi:hypothetical protein
MRPTKIVADQKSPINNCLNQVAKIQHLGELIFAVDYNKSLGEYTLTNLSGVRLSDLRYSRELLSRIVKLFEKSLALLGGCSVDFFVNNDWTVSTPEDLLNFNRSIMSSQISCEAEIILDEVKDILDSYPVCLTHGDLSMSNILQTEIGSLVLIDLEDISHNIIIADVVRLFLSIFAGSKSASFSSLHVDFVTEFSAICMIPKKLDFLKICILFQIRECSHWGNRQERGNFEHALEMLNALKRILESLG